MFAFNRKRSSRGCPLSPSDFFEAKADKGEQVVAFTDAPFDAIFARCAWPSSPGHRRFEDFANLVDEPTTTDINDCAFSHYDDATSHAGTSTPQSAPATARGFFTRTSSEVRQPVGLTATFFLDTGTATHPILTTQLSLGPRGTFPDVAHD